MLVVVRGAVSLGVKLRSPKLGWFMGAVSQVIAVS